MYILTLSPRGTILFNVLSIVRKQNRGSIRCIEKQSYYFAEKVFTFLSADEVEKLKQEEERKMASLSHAELRSWSPGEDHPSGYSSHSDDEPYENGHR